MRHLFKKTGIKTRYSKKYIEQSTKTMRAYKGPVPYLIRLLNEDSMIMYIVLMLLLCKHNQCYWLDKEWVGRHSYFTHL